MSITQTVLIIEDHEDLGELFKLHLESRNLNVLWAKSASEACSLIKQNPQLVVSDINLNSMQNGLDLCVELRKKGFTQPFMFITGSTSADYDKQAEKIGAIDFLYKPFELSTLCDKIVKNMAKINSQAAVLI